MGVVADTLSEQGEGLLARYETGPAFDEAFGPDGSVRGVYARIEPIIDNVVTYMMWDPDERGSTEIGVSLEELLAGGGGVCQDFAHLAIGMLRSVGVRTRYVSGYLFAADETIPTDGGLIPAGGVDEATAAAEPQTVRVQTHAWIEAALPGSGWWALDPTNGGPAGERHVVIGCSRDYGDVPPVRGTFTGERRPRSTPRCS